MAMSNILCLHCHCALTMMEGPSQSVVRESRVQGKGSGFMLYCGRYILFAPPPTMTAGYGQNVYLTVRGRTTLLPWHWRPVPAMLLPAVQLVKSGRRRSLSQMLYPLYTCMGSPNSASASSTHKQRIHRRLLHCPVTFCTPSRSASLLCRAPISFTMLHFWLGSMHIMGPTSHSKQSSVHRIDSTGAIPKRSVRSSMSIAAYHSIC